MINHLNCLVKNQSLEARRKKQDETGVFMIGKILNHKIHKGKRFYLIKWRDYPSQFNSWEPKNNLKQAWDLIDDYEREIVSKRATSYSKLKKANKPLKLAHTKKKKDEISSESSISDSNESLESNEEDSNGSSECVEEVEREYKDLVPLNSQKNLSVNIKQTEVYPTLPLKVMKLDIHLNGKLSAQIKWENGEVSSVNYENFKLRYPTKLLDFFESRIIFPFDNEGTKKFQETHKSQSQ